MQIVILLVLGVVIGFVLSESVKTEKTFNVTIYAEELKKGSDIATDVVEALIEEDNL